MRGEFQDFVDEGIAAAEEEFGFVYVSIPSLGIEGIKASVTFDRHEYNSTSLFTVCVPKAATGGRPPRRNKRVWVVVPEDCGGDGEERCWRIDSISNANDPAIPFYEIDLSDTKEASV